MLPVDLLYGPLKHKGLLQRPLGHRPRIITFSKSSPLEIKICGRLNFLDLLLFNQPLLGDRLKLLIDPLCNRRKLFRGLPDIRIILAQEIFKVQNVAVQLNWAEPRKSDLMGFRHVSREN